MFILGHIGITIGIFEIARRIPGLSGIPIDLRLVALGAMLPDLIDKPIGHVIFVDSIGNGRIVAHTLLFCLLLFLTGLYIYSNRQQTYMLVISAATFLHLLEDSLWNTPVTLFWPLLGTEFPNKAPHSGFLELFSSLLMTSYTPAYNQVFISEIIGLVCILLNQNKKLENKRYGKKA